MLGFDLGVLPFLDSHFGEKASGSPLRLPGHP
jgi:hypothetical protein